MPLSTDKKFVRHAKEEGKKKKKQHTLWFCLEKQKFSPDRQRKVSGNI